MVEIVKNMHWILSFVSQENKSYGRQKWPEAAWDNIIHGFFPFLCIFQHDCFSLIIVDCNISILQLFLLCLRPKLRAEVRTGIRSYSFMALLKPPSIWLWHKHYTKNSLPLLFHILNVEATARATLFWIYDNQRFVSDFFSWFLVRAQSYCTFNNNITKREPAKQSFSSECHFWNLPPKNTPLSVRERHFCCCTKFAFYPIFFNKSLVNSLVGFNFWPNLDWTNK